MISRNRFDELCETEKRNIRRGAALLDDKVPKWYERINKAKLDIFSTEDCVLGQLFKEFDVGIEEVGLNYERSATFGFNAYANFELKFRKQIQYTNYWCKQIDARLERDKNKKGDKGKV